MAKDDLAEVMIDEDYVPMQVGWVRWAREQGLVRDPVAERYEGETIYDTVEMCQAVWTAWTLAQEGCMRMLSRRPPHDFLEPVSGLVDLQAQAEAAFPMPGRTADDAIPCTWPDRVMHAYGLLRDQMVAGEEMLRRARELQRGVCRLMGESVEECERRRAETAHRAGRVALEWAAGLPGGAREAEARGLTLMREGVEGGGVVLTVWYDPEAWEWHAAEYAYDGLGGERAAVDPEPLDSHMGWAYHTVADAVDDFAGPDDCTGAWHVIAGRGGPAEDACGLLRRMEALAAPVSITLDDHDIALLCERRGVRVDPESVAAVKTAIRDYYSDGADVTSGTWKGFLDEVGDAAGIYPDTGIEGIGWEDSDADGVTDEDELAMGTNPDCPDTDGDGVPDGQEVVSGSDPLGPGAPGAAAVMAEAGRAKRAQPAGPAEGRGDALGPRP